MKSLFTIFAATCFLLARSQETFTLHEINPLHGNSLLTTLSDSAKTYYGAGGLTGFIELNGKLYFDAQSTPGDDELWVTDGTAGGTVLVKAINPGNGAAIGNMVLVNNHILFMATDNGSDWDLWSTDGTDTGTVKINKLNAPSNKALGPYNVSVMGNQLVFCAQQKLLITDGTAPGTDSLLSIAGYSQGFGYCELNNYTYFVLPEDSGDNEIWRTDGTVSGTQQALDLGATPFNIAAAKEVISFNNQIYLSAADSTQSVKLFTFDGTVNGQLNPVTMTSGELINPHGLKKYNNALYFIAGDSTFSNVYYSSSSNPSPTPLIPGAKLTPLSNLSFANNTAYCMEPGKAQIYAVELTGFTYSVLNLQGYHLPKFWYQNDNFLIGAEQQIYFEAYDSASGNEVFMQSDFTAAGTKAVMPAGANTAHPFNCELDNGIRDVFDLQMWGNNIIMPANFTDAGRELWIYTPPVSAGIAEAGNEGAFTIFPNPANNELTVKVVQYSNCEQNINIINAGGQVVMRQRLDGETTTIHLSLLAAGNYFVSLVENGSAISTQQLALTK